MLDRLDFWITIFTIGAGVYFLGWKDFVEPRVRPIVRWMVVQLRASAPTVRTEPFAPPAGTTPLPTANEPTNEPAGSVRSGTDRYALNGDDLAMVQRMILHNRTAIAVTKTETVYAGCGKKRGGGAAYVRCAELYDLFFTPSAEARFPTLTRARKQPAHSQN